MSQQEQVFEIQRLYIKDASFESPLTPQIFADGVDWAPEINLQINTESKALAEHVYEVVLSVTVTAKSDDKVGFLVEVHYAGIITIDGFEQEHLEKMLGTYCPNILFPYVRETVSDLVSKGGFPQLLLAPVNFDVLYAQHLERNNTAPENTTKQ